MKLFKACTCNLIYKPHNLIYRMHAGMLTPVLPKYIKTPCFLYYIFPQHIQKSACGFDSCMANTGCVKDKTCGGVASQCWYPLCGYVSGLVRRTCEAWGGLWFNILFYDPLSYRSISYLAKQIPVVISQCRLGKSCWLMKPKIHATNLQLNPVLPK